MDNKYKTCNVDNDCDESSLCAFNEKDLNNYCVNKDINELYYGCLNNNVEHNLESIETKSNSNNFTYLDCIDFSRRQINKEGIEYNYMVYKPKKDSFVDISTLNIYLKCDDEILAIIPYADYFNLKCDDSQQNCILESKESLLNFIIQNTKNCDKKIYLEIIYECENEGLKKNEKIFVDINNFNKILINLKCPIDSNNNKFKSKCESIYIDENDINQNNYSELIDFKKILYDCKNPLFKVPRTIKDISNYKKIKSKYSKNELKDYDKKISEKIEDLKKLEAEKYKKVRKIKSNVDISLEESYAIINKKSFDNLLNDSDKWKIFKNYDAAQNLYEENDKNKVLTYYGKVYTLNDAIKAANENDQSYFVWYNNSYELDDFASKLYFIDIFYGQQDLLKKMNWAKHENVTTCISKLDVDKFLDNTIKEEIPDESNEYITKITEIFKNSDENTEMLVEKIKAILSNSIVDSFNMHNNIIKHLNDKITTYGQAIQMNDYEMTINDKVLMILASITGFMILIFIALMGYLNYKYAGTVKLFGR